MCYFFLVLLTKVTKKIKKFKKQVKVHLPPPIKYTNVLTDDGKC